MRECYGPPLVFGLVGSEWNARCMAVFPEPLGYKFLYENRCQNLGMIIIFTQECRKVKSKHFLEPVTAEWSLCLASHFLSMPVTTNYLLCFQGKPASYCVERDTGVSGCQPRPIRTLEKKKKRCQTDGPFPVLGCPCRSRRLPNVCCFQHALGEAEGWWCWCGFMERVYYSEDREGEGLPLQEPKQTSLLAVEWEPPEV